MQLAVELADLLHLDLLGLFLEDTSLRDLASIPFSREFRSLGGGWHTIDLDQLSHDFELAARGIERKFVSAAKRLLTGYQFEVARGPMAKTFTTLSRIDDIVMIVDEEILNECAEPRQMVWFADVTVENRPMVISSYTAKEASGSFCDRGGRFGSHSSNESMAPVYYKKMAFISFFNAGVRALDIRDPYHPTEVGYFIPSITAATDKRCVKIDGKDRCKVAIQTNNVETDERGYIYIVDRANTGLHILELTGAARAVAGLP
ncbi:hypothetical protein GALL_534490 [mine drainage metagenome]|uniref:Uncharacterized protein n=1 Tax=mine drainage metagenome TaxID=410659 RepID=A0A1J5PBY4_9ZZZZ